MYPRGSNLHGKDQRQAPHVFDVYAVCLLRFGRGFTGARKVQPCFLYNDPVSHVTFASIGCGALYDEIRTRGQFNMFKEDQLKDLLPAV